MPEAVAELVSCSAEIIENVETLHGYSQLGPKERRFHAGRIKNGKVFVAVRRGERWLFSPSKFAGYRQNDLSHERKLDMRDGGVTNARIERLLGPPFLEGTEGFWEIDSAFEAYCSVYGIEPSRHPMGRRYWLITDHPTPPLAEEVTGSGFYEGAALQILVNRYERNPQARRACVEHYGFRCGACEELLEERYGELARDFIHVHHVVPLSEVREGYVVDPLRDLRRVCPNCHAMLHRGAQVLTLEALRKILADSDHSGKKRPKAD